MTMASLDTRPAAPLAALKVDAVLDVVLASALRLFEGDSGSIMLRVDVDELEVVASTANPQAQGARVRFGSGVAGKVAATGDGVLASGRGGGRSRPVDSGLCVPLLDGGHLFGVLSVNARPGRRFSDFDLVACTEFASRAADALSAARHYEIARGDSSSPARQHLLRLLSSIEAAASIDFVTPDPTGAADVADIARSISAEGSSSSHRIVVDGPASAVVHGRPQDVRRLLQELIDNAHRHGGTVARVHVAVSADDDHVVVTVTDDGPGIPEADRCTVLRPYGRLERRTDGVGVGLGFTIARRLAAAVGGSVVIVDRRDGGAAVEVCLPAPSPEAPRPGRPFTA